VPGPVLIAEGRSEWRSWTYSYSKPETAETCAPFRDLTLQDAGFIEVKMDCMDILLCKRALSTVKLVLEDA